MLITFDEKSKDEVIEYIQNTVFTKPHTCTIKKYSAPRSNQQNKYLWAVVYSLIAAEIGEEVETIHAICGQKFLSEVVEVGNEEYRVTKSTTKLTTIEFMEYVDRVIQFAWHELNISIPSPDAADAQVMEEIRQKYNGGLKYRNMEEDDF